MFANHSLPPLPSLANEHRHLRLTSEAARSHPHGGCQHPHQGSLIQHCACLTYHHNRSEPGNICDCGHSACYHAQNAGDLKTSTDIVVKALTEKVKKLEESIIKEREIRESIISRERQSWEREIRVLREALAPFYTNEKNTNERLMELADRLEGFHDEQMRIRDRMVSVDDAAVALDRRVNGLEGTHPRKRKEQHDGDDGTVSPGSYDCRSTSSHQSSHPPSPKPVAHNSAHNALRPTSPRSSGVLNLASKAKAVQGPQPYAATVQHNASRVPVHQFEEPRSSGFLGVDLVERLNQRSRQSSNNALDRSLSRPRNDRKTVSPVSPSSRIPSPKAPQPSRSAVIPLCLPPLVIGDGYVNTELPLGMSSPKRRKHQPSNMMALDVLANVSVASPLIH